ncbi:MAG: copper-binding protein [Burkholderiales bacterium]|nr:copper-binding protein [Burkholderiales bacterium]
MKSRNTILSMSVFAVAVVASSGASAQATMSGGKMGDMKMGDMKMEQSAAAAAVTDGEVRKVDKNAKKITIKHGPIKNLDMPGMTMVFQARDPAMLEKIQKGDKVKFKAALDGSALVITEIQPAN